MPCFHGTALSTLDAGDHQEVLVSGKVNFADLLTEISHEPVRLRSCRSRRPRGTERI